MDRKSFEKHKAFAGERVPSMKRRCLDHDYSARGIYMVTLVTKGRRKLFGDVAGRSDGQPGSADAPRMELSALGSEVVRCWESIPRFYPEVKPVALQLMPDHLHGILFVTRQMEDSDLGDVIKGFKTGCNKAFRGLAGVGCVGCVATLLQHTGQDAQRHTGHEHGFLFERGYNDRLLLREGQLQRWIDYLSDNPRRLLAKREHPDLFRVRYGHEVAGMTFAALGNRFLLDRPYKLQVQCSRSLTPADIEAAKARYLAEARQGAGVARHQRGRESRHARSPGRSPATHLPLAQQPHPVEQARRPFHRSLLARRPPHPRPVARPLRHARPHPCRMPDHEQHDRKNMRPIV